MARIGGDEFAVILPNTEIRGAFGVAEQICDRVKGLGLSSPTKSVTVTIGLAEMRGDSQISDYQLVQEADKALYKAKGEGRNQVQMAIADNNVVKMAHTS
jgi:diguanylate cyclase (GGDEF)-like protein